MAYFTRRTHLSDLIVIDEFVEANMKVSIWPSEYDDMDDPGERWGIVVGISDSGHTIRTYRDDAQVDDLGWVTDIRKDS